MVSNRLRNVWTPEQAIEIAPAPNRSGKPRPISLLENGKVVNYPSITDAAKSHKLKPNLVLCRMLRSKWTGEEALLEIVAR